MPRAGNRTGNSPVRPAQSLARQAFTLLEIVVVLLIITILSLLVFPNYNSIVAAAQEAMCAQNMRKIRLALGGYLEDHGMVWPQAPVEGAEQQIQQFWFATLEPYDISRKTWQCPTIRSKMEERQLGDVPMHYAPTAFDATPNIANRWATQPWLIEVADAHGHGPLICFPDGSVKSFYKVLAEQGAR
jgi:prepilin-type N-terminal cleavage/methylation domain-containing protein